MLNRRYASIYEYLEDYEFITEDEKRKIGNRILKSWDINKILLMHKYVNYMTNKEESKVAKELTRSFRNAYKTYIKNLNKPILPDKELIDYLPDYNNIDEQTKHELAIKSFNKLIDKYKEVIVKDMKRELVHSSNLKETSTYYNAIKRFKELYYKETHKKELVKINIYELFKVYNEDEKKFLDTLYDNLSNVEKRVLDMYLNREISQTDNINGVKTQYIINRFRRKIGSYRKNGYNHRNLYNYFDNYEWISRDDKIKIVNALIKDKDKILINKYINGEFKRMSVDGKKCMCIVTCAKEKYNKYACKKYIEITISKYFNKEFINTLSFQNKRLLFDIITNKPLTEKDLCKLKYLKIMLKKNKLVDEKSKKLIMGIR